MQAVDGRRSSGGTGAAGPGRQYHQRVGEREGARAAAAEGGYGQSEDDRSAGNGPHQAGLQRTAPAALRRIRSSHRQMYHS